MNKSAVYYVTGHGLGHARRSIRVMRAMLALDADLSIHIRSGAAAEVFADVLGPRVRHHTTAIDPGAAEDDPLTINAARTVERVRETLRRKDAMVSEEAEFVRQSGAGLVVADASFLAGDLAERAGAKCYAVLNFTWDWIYEPLLASQPDGAEILRQIQKSYAKMNGVLKLPFGGRVEMFREVIDSPMIYNRSEMSREEAGRRLGIEATDSRSRMLIGMRGGIAPQTIRGAAEQSPDMLFLCPFTMTDDWPANVLFAPAGMGFGDMMAGSDAVVSKLGIGIVSDCMGTGVALLWPPRTGFVEDDLIGREAGEYMRMRPIGRDEFARGDWRAGLRELLAMERPGKRMRGDGDVFCAGVLVERMGWG